MDLWTLISVLCSSLGLTRTLFAPQLFLYGFSTAVAALVSFLCVSLVSFHGLLLSFRYWEKVETAVREGRCTLSRRRTKDDDGKSSLLDAVQHGATVADVRWPPKQTKAPISVAGDKQKPTPNLPTPETLDVISFVLGPNLAIAFSIVYLIIEVTGTVLIMRLVGKHVGLFTPDTLLWQWADWLSETSSFHASGLVAAHWTAVEVGGLLTGLCGSAVVLMLPAGAWRRLSRLMAALLIAAHVCLLTVLVIQSRNAWLASADADDMVTDDVAAATNHHGSADDTPGDHHRVRKPWPTSLSGAVESVDASSLCFVSTPLLLRKYGVGKGGRWLHMMPLITTVYMFAIGFLATRPDVIQHEPFRAKVAILPQAFLYSTIHRLGEGPHGALALWFDDVAEGLFTLLPFLFLWIITPGSVDYSLAGTHGILRYILPPFDTHQTVERSSRLTVWVLWGALAASSLPLIWIYHAGCALLMMLWCVAGLASYRAWNKAPAPHAGSLLTPLFLILAMLWCGGWTLFHLVRVH